MARTDSNVELAPTAELFDLQLHPCDRFCGVSAVESLRCHPSARWILFHLSDSLGPGLANDHYGDAFHLHPLGVRQVDGWPGWPLAGTGSALCSLHCGLLVYHSASVNDCDDFVLDFGQSNLGSLSCCALELLGALLELGVSVHQPFRVPHSVVLQELRLGFALPSYLPRLHCDPFLCGNWYRGFLRTLYRSGLLPQLLQLHGQAHGSGEQRWTREH
mmetsp:Transcript_74969/g.119122  ORF Transcript_74969/g.119122 Transcript_74969/m.119122 type:complete len:217 (+) Transcript_74969:87-737(+)